MVLLANEVTQARIALTAGVPVRPRAMVAGGEALPTLGFYLFENEIPLKMKFSREGS